MIVAKGDHRRKREAVERLVADIARGAETDVVFTSLRVALERGWTSILKDVLMDAEKKKVAEIDRICARNYEGFIESVEEMLMMRGSAGKVTSMVHEINSEVSKNGEDLIEVLNELERIQKERVDTKKALEAAQHCQRIVSLVVHAKTQIQMDDHYGALSTIETIQAEKANVIVKNFASSLKNWVSDLIESLVGAAQREVDQWQAKLRQDCALLGETIMLNYVDMKVEYKALRNTFSSLSIQQIRKHASIFRLNYWAAADQFGLYSPYFLQQERTPAGLLLVNDLPDTFAPLHKAYFIISAVGDVKAFRIRCSDSRQRTVSSFIELASSSAAKNGLAAVFPLLMHQVCGFFVSECVARQIVDYETNSSWSELCALWERCWNDISKLTSLRSTTLKTTDEIIQCKEVLLLVMDTLSDETFGLKADPVLSTACVFLYRFKQLIQTKLESHCKTTLASAPNQPFFVASQFVYDSQIRAFQLHALEETSSSSSSSPVQASAGGKNSGNNSAKTLKTVNRKLDELEADIDATLRGPSSNSGSTLKEESFAGETFPFSSSVPTLLQFLYESTVDLFIFLHRNEYVLHRGDVVVQTVLEGILSFAKAMQSDLTRDGTATPLAKSCQISVDASVLQQACLLLYKRVIGNALAVYQWTDSSSDLNMATALKRVNKELTAVSNQAMDTIFENLGHKVDDLLSSLQYEDWEPQAYPLRKLFVVI